MQGAQCGQSWSLSLETGLGGALCSSKFRFRPGYYLRGMAAQNVWVSEHYATKMLKVGTDFPVGFLFTDGGGKLVVST